MTDNTLSGSDISVTTKHSLTEVEADKIKGTQELDEILDTLAEKSADSDSRLGYVDAYVFAQEAKQAIQELIDKKVKEALGEQQKSKS